VHWAPGIPRALLLSRDAFPAQLGRCLRRGKAMFCLCGFLKNEPVVCEQSSSANAGNQYPSGVGVQIEGQGVLETRTRGMTAGARGAHGWLGN